MRGEPQPKHMDEPPPPKADQYPGSKDGFNTRPPRRTPEEHARQLDLPKKSDYGKTTSQFPSKEARPPKFPKGIMPPSATE